MILLSNTQNRQITNNHQCLGVVLAGGLSSRMGIDKASLIRNETNMLNYSKQLLTGIGLKNIVISGKTPHASAQDIVVPDQFKAMGPMGGIASVIEQYQPAALFVLPVDLPLITTTILQKLKQVGELSQQACFYNNNFLPLYLPVNAFTETFFKQAFIEQSNIDKNCAEPANKNIRYTSSNIKAKNGPSIRALLSQIPHKTLNINNPSCLLNTNTPEDWAIAQHSFSLLNSAKKAPLATNHSKKHLLNSKENYV